MGTSLTGVKIKDSYDSLLKVTDNGPLDGTLQTITDGLGNNSALSLSTAGASVGGTLAVSGNAAFDTNTLFVDAANNRVGIGTSSPDEKLTINNAGSFFVRLFDSSNSASSYWGLTSGNEVYFGSSSASDVTLYANGSERMRLDSSGDISFRDSSANEAFYWDASAASLSIGAGSSPSQKLSILSSSATATVAKFAATNYSNLGTTYIEIGTQFGDGGSRIGSLNPTGNQSSLVFETMTATGGVYAERMRIDNNGNVGIGTASIDSKLRVEFNPSGTVLAGLRVGFNNSSSNLYDADIHYFRNGAGSAERMRITSSGNLLVGTATDNGQKFQVLGAINSLGVNAGLFTQNRPSTNLFGFYGDTNLILYNSDIGTIGTFAYNTGTYTPVSDVNRKKDFEDSTIGLEAVLGLKPTLYRMKDDDEAKDKQLGFIAQEVKDFIPQAYVENGEDESKFIGLQDRPIIAALVKAVQELNDKIVSLESKLA